MPVLCGINFTKRLLFIINCPNPEDFHYFWHMVDKFSSKFTGLNIDSMYTAFNLCQIGPVFPKISRMFNNLNSRSWGLFWPRRNITCHYFLIGWTYWCVNMSHTTLYANAPKHPRRCDGVRYDPKTHIGVKKDPRTCLTWLFFGPVIRVNKPLFWGVLTD